MHSERSLDHAHTAFRQGRFAEETVMALARAAAGKEPTADDCAALNRAVDFLRQVRDGYGWLETPEVTSDSPDCAAAFASATRSIYAIGHDPGRRFVADLDCMLATTEALSAGSTAPPVEIQRVRRFFADLQRAALDLIDQALAALTPQASKDGWQFLTTT